MSMSFLLATLMDRILFIFVHMCVLSHFSCVQLFATLWTVAYQTSLSMSSPGKNTGVGCHATQRIFPTQGWNPHLLHCMWILYH